MSQRQVVPTKAGTPPMLSSSPGKRQRVGITLEQKQAIIDNLQLEITDRARRLRAQYNQQAQTLRSRIQMRVNRVPRSLLKMTMADLVDRANEQQRRLEAASRPPPVPEKDFPPRTSPFKLAPPARPAKRLSDAMAGGDKENDQILNPKKKHRAAPATLSSSQVLSPTSSNTRSLVRERPSSPSKSSQIARPMPSPVKQHTSARSALTSMVEKAKKTGRGAPPRALTASTASSNASAPAPATGTVPPTRTRRANTTTASKAPSRPGTRTGKRVSDSSEGSTGTVVKKTTAAAPPKRTVMGTIRKGVGAATARKPAAPKSAPASTTGSTRVLRKRG
ncbi:hypothetical protein EsH8_VI_000647 [Colletotrichum jinshuiense]